MGKKVSRKGKIKLLPFIACLVAIIGVMTVAYGDMNANDTSAGWDAKLISPSVKIGKTTYTKSKKLKVLEILPIEQQSELGYMLGSDAQPVPLEDIVHLLYPDNKTKKTENYDNFTACLQTWDELMHNILGSGYDIQYYMKNDDGTYEWKNVNFQTYGGFQTDKNKEVYDKLTYRFVTSSGDIIGYKDENDNKWYAYNLLAYSLYNNPGMCDKMELIKKTPSKVTMEDIESANLIYMSARGSFATTGKYHDLYNKMAAAVKAAYTTDSAEDKAMREKYPEITTAKTYASANEDLSAEVAWKLYREVANKNVAFMYDDMDFESKTVSNGNIFKIFILINCADRDLFKQQFWKDEVTANTHYSGEEGYVKVEDNTINIYYTYHNPWNSSIVQPDHKLGNGTWHQYMFTNQGADDAFYYSVMGTSWTSDSEYYYGIDGWPSRRVNVWDNVFVSSGWNTIIYNGISGNIDLNPDIKGSSIQDALSAFGKGSTINISAIIKYILGDYGFETVISDEIRVLEIEPAGGYNYSDISTEPDLNLVSDSELEENVKKVEGLLNYFNVRALKLDKTTYWDYIDVKSVAMNEFIAMTEDIVCNYDLVIVGDYNKYNGKELLNTSKTLIYTARGPLHTFASITETGIKDTVLSGNDLTTKALKKLQEYVAADKVLVLADSICNGDTSVVWSSSNVYKLKELYDAQAGKENQRVLKASDNEDEYLRKPAYYARVSFSVEPKNTALTITKPGNMIKMNKSDLSGFKFKGQITNYSIKSTYTVSVYVDKDGNGFYNETTEKVLKNQVLGDDDINNSTGVFETSALALGNDLKGYLGFKVVISDGNTSSDFNGSFVIKYGSDEARTVRILQIYSECKTDNTGFGQTTLLLRNTDGSKSTFQRTVEKYASQIEEETGVSFNFGKDGSGNYYIDEMTCAEFSKKYEKLKDAKGGAALSFPEDDWLVRDYKPLEGIDKGYDIIVMGFADAYGYDDIENADALNDLYYYISSGNPVLMGHDVISFAAYSTTVDDGEGGVVTQTLPATLQSNDKTKKWSYNITTKLRNIIGMDRFGVTVNSGGLTTETYNQGYANGFLSDAVLLKNKQPYSGQLYNSSLSNNVFTGESARNTTQITKINSGQITQYPLNVDGSDTLTISTTHPQYFQLNLDEIGNGENDVIVWYSLSKSGNNYYSYSGNDALNNYYIYSKGNVTYSGAGHRTIEYDKGEMKLFINTIIKALGKFNSFPEVTFTNALETKKYSQYEMTIRPNQNITDLDIQFKVCDSDIEDGEQLSDSYMFLDLNKDEEGNLAPNGVYDEGTDMLLVAYTDTNHLLNNNVYTVPISGLSDNAIKKIKEMLETNQLAVTVMASDNQGGKGTAKCSIIYKDLFNLE